MAVFFAAVLFVFIGMTGLAVDYGFASLERRVLQNAVDAAATTGAGNLSRGEAVSADVNTLVGRNGVGLTATVDCQYIDNTGAVTGPCSGAASATTGGVKVTATNLRPTYFMRVFGPQYQNVTVSATLGREDGLTEVQRQVAGRLGDDGPHNPYVRPDHWRECLPRSLADLLHASGIVRVGMAAQQHQRAHQCLRQVVRRARRERRRQMRHQ
jgi:putative Flp pilus-assembly TadE/G-like protein